MHVKTRRIASYPRPPPHTTQPLPRDTTTTTTQCMDMLEYWVNTKKARTLVINRMGLSPLQVLCEEVNRQVDNADHTIHE